MLAAAANAGATEPQQLEEMVVSASRGATRLAETPAAIGVVRQDILQRDRPKTMGEVVNRIAGVYWNDLGNEQHSMSIRQPVSTNAVYQYLEDGIPIRPLGVFNHNALNEINLAGTDSVEVVKGAASSLYGSNAVGGAINFMTAAPSPTPYASVSVRRDNINGYQRLDTAASDTWGDLGLRFSHYSARRSGDNWQQYSRGDKDAFSLRGDYVLSDHALLRATLVHTELDAAMTGTLNQTDYQRQPGKSVNRFTYRRDISTRANLAWEAETVARGLSTVTLFSRKNDHGQLPSYTLVGCSAGATVCQGSENNSHVDSLGLDLKHQQDFVWLASRLLAGVYLDNSAAPYTSNNLRVLRDPASGNNLSYSNANLLNPKGVRDYRADIRNVALFGQWEASPLAATRVVLGARADRIRYDYRNTLAPAGSDNYGAASETRSFSRISPKLGATYALDARSNVYANLSRGFTPPELSQLYGKTGVPDLRPATYNNYELGLRSTQLDGALKLNAALYRLDGSDTIVSYTIAPGNSENRNAGRTRSQGLELGLNYDAGPFDARLATALASHRYRSYRVAANLDYSGKQMPQAPADISSAELGYRPAAGARVALELLHQGRYWMNNANTVRYGGHTLLNLRANQVLAGGWEVWLQVRNLSDRRYADNASSAYTGLGAYLPDSQNAYTPGAPRSVMLGLNYTYGKH
ncbi:TonB-dependent receptor [Duganella sp. HSC-15S17]|nr:TonB-dependent receptor [Duganella violaceicalia]